MGGWPYQSLKDPTAELATVFTESATFTELATVFTAYLENNPVTLIEDLEHSSYLLHLGHSDHLQHLKFLWDLEHLKT